MYKENLKDIEVFYEMNFLYFTNKEPKNNKDNINSRFYRHSNIRELKLELDIMLQLGDLKNISRLFINKYVNGKKTWSKVLTVNIGNRITPDFLKFIEKV